MPFARLLMSLWAIGALGADGFRAQDRFPVQRLTFDPAQEGFPRWSPDGTRIAFTSTRANSFDVWVMALDLAALRAALDSAGGGIQ